MPLILGANTLSAGGYEVDNSLRFNRGSSDYLSRTPASSGNRRTWTFSTWVKRSSLTGNQDLITSGSALQVVSYIYFYTANGIFAFEEYTGGYQINIKSNAYLRDLSAWYNLIIAVDTTQGTASNRIKMYINGNQVTSLSASTYPSQNFECNINSNTLHNIGCEQNGTNCIDGYLAETVFIDGQQLAPSDFGEFDSDSGIWKPIDVSDLTFGTNGFYLEFKDSSALGDDTSGTGNDWTVNNLTSIDQTTDTPTNNFATANPLHFNATIPSAGTLSDGNLTFTSSQGASAYPAFYSTIGASQGKWYAEFKVTTANSAIIGIGSGIATGGFLGGGLYDYAYYYDGTFYNNGSNQGTQSSYTDGDIISVAMDLDNNKIYVAKDNVWQHSGDPSAGTGGFAITAPASNNTGTYLIAYGDAGGGTPAIQGNFGNPPFAITTGNEDANGYGNFEYAVPPGYYALNTKNLAEYG
jgi:hypothetical protein